MNRSKETATLSAIATILGVGIEQVNRDLCFAHRRLVKSAVEAAEEACK